MIPMNKKASILNENMEPFVWLFKESSPEEQSRSFFYSESLDLNVNSRNEPYILVNPFFAGTQTKTEIIQERDKLDD